MKNFLATALLLMLAYATSLGQSCDVPSTPPVTEPVFDEPFNIDLQQHYFPPEMQGAFYNDCWGWEDPETGKEYAIFGSLENVYIVDITDSENGNAVLADCYSSIVEVENIPLTVEYILSTTDTAVAQNAASSVANVPSLWRDFKTYGNYAYGVVDLGTNTTSEEGLLVFDLSKLKDGGDTYVKRLSTPSNTGDYFELAHNLFVDEPEGKLYAVGVRGDADIKIYDITQTPETPQLIETINFDAVNIFIDENGEEQEVIPGFNGYVHDIFVENNIAYCSHINSGEWAIWNLNGMGEPGFEPLLVAYVNTEHLQHSSWPNKDRTAFVFCEETANEPVGFIDVSDVNYNTGIGNDIAVTYLFRDPLLRDQTFISTNPLDPIQVGDTMNIAHNAFIRGDYVYVAYYEDGLQVFDISLSDFSKSAAAASDEKERNPPPRVAYMDTSPETTGRQGAASLPYGTRLPTWNNWGTYPYFSSDKIIATDTEYGLFIMKLIGLDDGSEGTGYDVGSFNGATSSGALAVDLAKFTAQADKNRVLIEWETESELHHSSFTIERSRTGDANSWDLLKDVEAKGNVPYRMKYAEYDEKPLQGRSYYRLRMGGLDARTSYSDVITVDFETTVMEVTVSPTLVKTNQIINIGLQNAVVNTLDVQVVDMIGQVVAQQQLSSANGIDFELNLIDLPNGNYLLSLNGGNVSTTERISVMK